MGERQKPGVPFWATVALAAVMLAPAFYLIACGPWLWVTRLTLGWTAEEASVGAFAAANSFARTAEPMWMAWLADGYESYLEVWIQESDYPFP